MPDMIASTFATTIQGVKLRYKALVDVSGVDSFRLKARAINEGDVTIVRVASDSTVLDSFVLGNPDPDFQVGIQLQIDEKHCTTLREKPYSLIQEAREAISSASPSNVNEKGFTRQSVGCWKLVVDTKPLPDFATEVEEETHKAIQHQVYEVAFYLLRRLADSNHLPSIPHIFKQVHIICWAVNSQDVLTAVSKQIQEEIEAQRDGLFDNLVISSFPPPYSHQFLRLTTINSHQRHLSYVGDYLLFAQQDRALVPGLSLERVVRTIPLGTLSAGFWRLRIGPSNSITNFAEDADSIWADQHRHRNLNNWKRLTL